MSQVFDTIGNIFGKIGGFGSKVLNAGGGKLVPALATGAGTLANYLTGRKTTQAIDQQLAWDKYVQQLVSNPGAFSKFAQGYTQPLTAGVVAGTENADQAWLAEHGLSQSPAIAGDVLNQSLGQLIQQQQNQGMQDAFAALSAGGSKLAPQLAQNYGRPIDLTSLLKMLMQTNPQSPKPVGQTAGGQHTPQVDINPTLDPTLGGGPSDATVGDLIGGVDQSGGQGDWGWLADLAGGGFSPGG